MDRRPEPQRRTMMLWEQMSTPEPAIRDFLKTSQDAGSGGGFADRRPCTLMDAICRESRGDSGVRTVNWKPLRDRLRLRRLAKASSTTTRNRRAGENVSEEEGGASKGEARAVPSMSLMALLEQTDDQWDDDEEEDSGCSCASNSCAVVKEEEEDGEGREEGMLRECCVCMVRHRGAAFIPCGHTFCRLCSRELWHTGASCPLCNAFIHDILHIF